MTACGGGGGPGPFPPPPPPVPASAKAITAFSIGGVGGVINGTNRTVTVTLPLNTPPAALTGLTPVITHSGASISPGANDPQNFYRSGFTPVTYTVTAADGSRAVWTVIVKLESLAPGANIGTYLSGITGAYDGSGADRPIPLPVTISLPDDWAGILSAIQTAGKYVALDLSACTMTGAEFDPDAVDTDANRVAAKGKIVSLILPDAAAGIKAGTSSNPTFKNFTGLKSVTGAHVTSIGDYAFYQRITLATVSLPAATTIGEGAFGHCTTLTTVSLPAATTIRNGAFFDCAALETVELPAATSIGSSAFEG
jgi:hypothetical protein